MMKNAFTKDLPVTATSKTTHFPKVMRSFAFFNPGTEAVYISITGTPATANAQAFFKLDSKMSVSDRVLTQGKDCEMDQVSYVCEAGKTATLRVWATEG